MSTYLLLRSNKKSGPYNLDDLVKSGLKPYDLVWVEGKSAAWRYPGEIEELKPYAPMVEEQPYDRFFKKGNTEKKQEPVAIVEKKQIQPVQAPVIDIEEKYEKYTPQKSVVVTLPTRKKVAVQMPVQVVKESVPVPPVVSLPTITVTENPAAQIKYSQPLDEIKEMYVKTLQERKSKIARKGVFFKNLKMASVIAGLITIGLLAGFIIKSDSGKKESNISQQNIPPSQKISNETEQQTQEQVPNESLQQENDNNKATNEDIQQEQSEPVAKVQEPIRQKSYSSENTIKKEAPPTTAIPEKKKDIIEKPFMPSGVEKDPLTGERKRVIRDNDNTEITDNIKTKKGNDQTNDKPIISSAKKNIFGNLVSVTSNDYKRVAFGGIRNLELTVTNDSKFVLDKVTVELQYLRPTEAPFRTENIEFHSVSAGGAQTLKIPDTNRGAKITYKVIDVQSAQQATASSGL